MKTFIVLALFFTAVNSSFLRNLDDRTISTLAFTESCVLLEAGKLALSATVDPAFAAEGAKSYKATFVSGENSIEAETGTVGADPFTTISWEATFTKTGVYKVTEIKDTTESGADVITLPKELPSCVVTVAGTVNTTATATTTQEVTEGDKTKGSFTFVVEETLTQPPVVYTAETNGKVIANCKVESDINVVCSPTKDEMEDGKEYTIYYHNGCDTGITSTTAKVKFTAKDSSAFMTLGKIALFALALLF